jgi:beta-lactamase class A
MNRNTSPGVGQWLTASLIVFVSMFLLVKLYQYAGTRTLYPTGLTVGGVDVGQMTEEEATAALTEQYINTPIMVYHGEEQFEVSPTRAEFTLDIDTMLNQADFQRTRQDFWAGFWGFLWGRPVDVEPVELSATHNRDALRLVLEEITSLTDTPAQPAQPVPSSMSFQYGTAGVETDIEASFADVEAALYRPNARDAHLVVAPKDPERPNINLLIRLLVNRLQVFEQDTGGVASVFILDLQTGQEVDINGQVPMSANHIMKIPLIVELFRTLDGVPSLSQRQLISDTLVISSENEAANTLLNTIAGAEDPYKGAELLTASMQRLGLVNTFMLAPFDQPLRPGQRPPETPANSVETLRTRPTETMQTTAEDIGTLLSMIYYCANGRGGALVAVYPDEDWQSECLQMLEYMEQNKIGSLLEEGLPPGTLLAHRHGWISDTHADAGIVFTPAGDYVIVEFLYKPDWLEWELSSPLLADVSRAAYNYFNFDAPYLGSDSAATNNN